MTCFAWVQQCSMQYALFLCNFYRIHQFARSTPGRASESVEALGPHTFGQKFRDPQASNSRVIFHVDCLIPGVMVNL